MAQRSNLSSKERECRSRLNQLIAGADGFLRGSLIQMARTCGNANCKCVKKGEKHVSLYIGQTHKGKTRMQYIPKHKEDQVRRWVSNYKKAQEFMGQICEQRWQEVAKTIKKKKDGGK